MDERKILILVGPTAVGKTQYSIELAKVLDGEIVSADSMQLYKYMDIGSAKPTPEERSEAVHYLVDEIDPHENFSVFEYQKRAKKAINDIFQKGRIPIISGGTGLYVNSLIYDMDFSAPPKSLEFRKELEIVAESKGNKALHDILRELDEAAAERIHPNNVKKIIRAIEMLKEGQDKVFEFEESFVETKDYKYCLIGLKRNREELYKRINERVDLLMEHGLLEEIKALEKIGLTEEYISMKGIGYKEIFGYFKGEYSLDETVELVKRNTRRYAKRQMTWFRRYENIHWIDLSLFEENSHTNENVVNQILEIWKDN